MQTDQEGCSPKIPPHLCFVQSKKELPSNKTYIQFKMSLKVQWLRKTDTVNTMTRGSSWEKLSVHRGTMRLNQVPLLKKLKHKALCACLGDCLAREG